MNVQTAQREQQERDHCSQTDHRYTDPKGAVAQRRPGAQADSDSIQKKQKRRAWRHRYQVRSEAGQSRQVQDPSQQREKTGGCRGNARRQQEKNQDERIPNTPFFLCNGFHK
jgi:hypothetical protein